MSDRYTTSDTEMIPGEDWCVKCEQDVNEWKVSFETTIHSDGDFEKVRRCPHCNARCFTDRSFSAGCFVFFLAFYGGIAWFPLLKSWKINIPLESPGLICFLLFLHGLAVSQAFTWSWKKILDRRRRPISGGNRPCPPT